MRIHKVKFSKGTVTAICSDQNVEKRVSRETTFTCEQEPRPEFVQAFDGLAKAAMHEIDAPKDWRDHVTCTGASFSWGEGDTLGIVVTCLVDLDNFQSPLVINTPFKRQSGPNDMANGPFLDGAFEKAALIVLDEAVAYVKGARAQLDLEDMLRAPEAQAA